MVKLNFKLKEPQHGWLLVQITNGKFKLEFDASDVPNNPLYDLTVSLCKVLNGLDSEVWWHLEPAGYYFYFKKLVDGKFELCIKYEQDSSFPKKHIETLNGTKQELILPLWRALKEFASHGYAEPHWRPTDHHELKKLTSLLKGTD